MTGPQNAAFIALRGGKPPRTPYLGDGSFVFVDYAGRRPPRSGRDAWGVEWTPLPASYVAGADEPAESYATGHPAANAAEVRTLPLPVTDMPARFASDGALLIGQHPAGPLDRFLSLLGAERGYRALAAEPESCKAALTHIARHHVQVAEGYLAAGVAAALLPDDYAGQGGPILSPTLWRAIVLPAVAPIVDVYRRAGAALIFHTCGAAQAFIGDLLDVGVTAFNLETAACDLAALKARYGTRIAFYGGVSAAVMLQSTPEEVARAVYQAAETLGREGGLVLAPDQPLAYSAENGVAFREAAQSAS